MCLVHVNRNLFIIVRCTPTTKQSPLSDNTNNIIYCWRLDKKSKKKVMGN